MLYFDILPDDILQILLKENKLFENVSPKFKELYDMVITNVKEGKINPDEYFSEVYVNVWLRACLEPTSMEMEWFCITLWPNFDLEKPVIIHIIINGVSYDCDYTILPNIYRAINNSVLKTYAHSRVGYYPQDWCNCVGKLDKNVLTTLSKILNLELSNIKDMYVHVNAHSKLRQDSSFEVTLNINFSSSWHIIWGTLTQYTKHELLDSYDRI